MNRLDEIATDPNRATPERKKAINSLGHLQKTLLPESPAGKEVERRLQELDQRDLGDRELEAQIDTIMRGIGSETDARR